jgi:Asp-tRNA(Asn)/Glu-tRNA(Gln) amidotransferase A subunit family amidase
MSDTITARGAGEIADAIRSKRLSPVEVTKAHLDRIDRTNGDYRAFITVTRPRP